MLLREKVELNQQNLGAINEELTDLMAYLSSSKFHGIENNFVNAQEMLSRIQKLWRMTTDAQADLPVRESWY